MIVMISGKQKSGKTTTADALSKALVEDGTFVWRMKFASAIYKMHDAARAALREIDSFNTLGLDYKEKDGDLLQLLGTEWGRRIDPDIWVKLAKIWIHSLPYQKDCVVIDDLRFRNEMSIIKEAFGDQVLTVRLTCPEDCRKSRPGYWRDNTDHPSETDLDQWAGEGRFDVLIASSKLTPEQCAHLIKNAIELRKQKIAGLEPKI